MELGLKATLSSAIICFILPLVTEQIVWPPCPNTEAVDSFDIKKFEGLWYLDSYSEGFYPSCVSYDFKDVPGDGTIQMTESQQVSPLLNRIVNIIFDHNNPGHFTPNGAGGYLSLTVIDTDYSYAVLMKCVTIFEVPIMRGYLLLLRSPNVITKKIRSTIQSKYTQATFTKLTLEECVYETTSIPY